MIGSGQVTFNFNVVPGINYTKCSTNILTSSTASTGPFTVDTNATIGMNLTVDPQVLSLTSNDAAKAGLWYYKKDLMLAGVGTETFQIQYCNMELPSSS